MVVLIRCRREGVGCAQQRPRVIVANNPNPLSTHTHTRCPILHNIDVFFMNVCVCVCTAAVNLGQGFPDWPCAQFVKDALYKVVQEDGNQVCSPVCVSYVDVCVSCVCAAVCVPLCVWACVCVCVGVCVMCVCVFAAVCVCCVCVCMLCVCRVCVCVYLWEHDSVVLCGVHAHVCVNVLMYVCFYFCKCVCECVCL